MNERPSIIPLILVAMLCFACFALAVMATQAQSSQYLKLGRLYEFEYLDSLPYEQLGRMAWDEERGFYEVTETPHYLYTLINLETGALSYVLQTDTRCFAFVMEADLGSDGMPHVQEAEWVTCDEQV